MYQSIANEVDKWCSGDLTEIEKVANYLIEYVVQKKESECRDQMYIHSFCE